MKVTVLAIQAVVLFATIAWCLGTTLPTAKRRHRSVSPLKVIETLGRPATLLILALLTESFGLVFVSGSPSPGIPLPFDPSSILLLAAYPFVFSAAMSLPSAPRSGASRIRMLVDGLLLLAGAATFSWYFVLGPIIVKHWATSELFAMNVAYPVLDLGLVAGLLILSARTIGSSQSRSRYLAGGIAVLVCSDSLWQHQSLFGASGLSTMLLAVHLLSFLILAAAAVAFAPLPRRLVARSNLNKLARPIKQTESSDVDPESVPHVWDSFLPYALLPAAGTLAVLGWNSSVNLRVTEGVIAGTVILVALTFVRQILAIQENLHLYRKINQTYLESLSHSTRIQALNEELHRTRDELQFNNEALANANLRLQAQATTDPLTGLPNHRSMVLALDQELDRARRYSRSCSVLFLDIDHFKALNDNCGHLAGDTVLREIVASIVNGLRSADVAGRWGGEEFVVVLPETEVADAVTTAERIRRAVSEHRFSVGAGAHLTCSVGVATYPYDATTRDSVVEAADRAMYAAKRLGRNQVRTAVDPSVVGFISEVRKGGSREEVSLWGMVEALTTIVKAHDESGDEHAEGVADLAMRVAVALNLTAPEIRTVGLAARLHDLGKVSIPDAILGKPDKLDEQEWAKVTPHPGVGADVVRRVPGLITLAPLIRGHHERWDGSGYPDGLHGEEIPIGARIIGACDAYNAMTSTRVYRSSLPIDEALAELDRCSGTQFDPAVIDALRRVVLDELGLTAKQAV